jgi:polysaccharide biosynthesis protein PelD
MASEHTSRRDRPPGLAGPLLFNFRQIYGRDLRAALRDTQPVAYAEIVIGLGLLVAINLLFFRNDNWGFFDANPHPFWLIILPIAARYGALPAYTAGLLAAGIYLLFVIFQPRSAFAVDIFSTQAFLNPVLFVVVGGLLGEVREAQKRAHGDVARRYDEMEASLQDLAQRYLAAVEINREMERRIVTQTSTVTTLYQAAKALEQLEIEELAPSILQLVTDFIEADACALYLRRDGQLELKEGRPAEVSFARPPTLDTSRGIVGLVSTDRRTITVRDVLAEATPSQIMAQPLLMATPLLGQNGEIIGVIAVERMPFLRFTPTAVKLFTLLGDWASTAFQTALRFQETRDRNVSDELTGAYNLSYITKRLAQEVDRARRYDIPLTLVALRVEQHEAIPPVKLPTILQTLGFVFRQHIRPIDILGKGATDDTFLVVLPHMTAEEGRAVAERVRGEIEAFGFRPFDDDRTLRVQVALASAAEAPSSADEMIERVQARLGAGSPASSPGGVGRR